MLSSRISNCQLLSGRKAGVFLNRCPRRCGTSGSSGQHGTVLGGRISCIADADVGVVEQGGAQVKARGGASVCALADGIMPSCLSRFSAGNLSVLGLLDRWRKSSTGDQVISPTCAYLDREAYILAERTAEEIAARRARRKERRQNQREANFERANKMHKVRLASPDAAEVMAADPLAGSIHIGCSGWYYWHWKGNFYPAEVPANRWFAIYQDHFSTVELNAPFYSWPTVSAVKTWIRQAEPNFIYTIKVCELITHIKRFEDTAILIKDFGYIADLLGSQMGCFLFQLPPSLRYSPELLHSIISQLDPRCRNVVEFRHKSWWNANVYQAFNAAQVIFCSCSGPRLPDELVRTSDDIYVRFHGIKQWYRHDYSDDELKVWAERIHTCGAKTVWVYFNNDRDGYSIKNACRMSELLCR